MDGWDTQDIDEIVVGRRRMRVGRRRPERGRKAWIMIVVLALLAGGGAGVYYWLNRPTPQPTVPEAAVVAPGGFRASIGDNHTITVGLEVRNAADVPVTLLEARIVAPAGLTSTALAIIPTGDGNTGFALDGDLPPTAPVELGTDGANRNAIVAARFKVDCAGLLATGAPLSEQIFVTIQVGSQQREEELTPPAVGDLPWLAGTAQRVCLDPVNTAKADPPLPPLENGKTPGTGSG